MLLLCLWDFKLVDATLYHKQVHILLTSPVCPAGTFCLLGCRSSLQTDILHARCTVKDYKSISFNTYFNNQCGY